MKNSYVPKMLPKIKTILYKVMENLRGFVLESRDDGNTPLQHILGCL